MVRRLRVAAGLALVALLVAAAPVAATGNRFVAVLSAQEEVPTPTGDTAGRGVATFKLSPDGSSLDFKLNVANIDDVTQSHIHCGAPGVAGPVVVFLFGFVADGVTVNGRLSEGTITPANVIARPDSAACPGGIADFEDLLAKMRSGQAYVNVHTIENPPGEIRGQLRCNIPGQGE